jgi:3-oxoadipate enol-lactonase
MKLGNDPSDPIGSSTMTTKHGSFSTSDGCAIAYAIRHNPEARAPRLALVHSLALDRSVWDGVVEQLAGRAEILTYDCRGHGRSGRPHLEYTAELFGRDLGELLDHLGWEKAIIAGCSMGGCVAQAFAGLYPKRASALALIDTTAWYGSEAPKQFRDRAAAAKAKGMQGLIDFQVTRWFSEKFAAANPQRVKQATDVFLANDFECYASTCALLGDADLRHYLPSFRMPVAIVVGEEDYATPIAMAKALHAAIPQSTLKIISGGRHLTPIQCPDEIAAEIGGLLERI